MAKKTTASPAKKDLIKSYAFKITGVELENHQASGETVTAVTIDVLKDNKVVEVRRLGFSAELTKEEITVELTKVVESIANDHRIAADSAKTEAQTAKANELKDELLGQKVEVATKSPTK